MFHKVLKEKMMWHYIEQIYRPLMNMKNKDIFQFEKRKDYLQVLAINDQNFIEMKEVMGRIYYEEQEKIKKKKLDKIDIEKNRWLIKTIEKKLNTYLSISLQVNFKLDYIYKVLWNRLTLAISNDKVSEPTKFIEEFFDIIFKLENQIKIQLRLTQNENNKLKKLQQFLLYETEGFFKNCIFKKYVKNDKNK